MGSRITRDLLVLAEMRDCAWRVISASSQLQQFVLTASLYTRPSASSVTQTPSPKLWCTLRFYPHVLRLTNLCCHRYTDLLDAADKEDDPYDR